MEAIRDLVSVSTSRSRDGLETYPRSRLGLVSDNLANVSVSVSGLNVSVSVSALIGSRAQAIVSAITKQQLTSNIAKK
jgi:hypothetical protein